MNDSTRSVLVQGIDAFAGIVRFRKGPEDVPASSGLLALVLVGAVALRLAMLALPVPETVNAPQASRNPGVLILLELGIMLLCVQVALRLATHPERFQQTITAILGCQLLLAPVWLASRWMLLNWYEDPTLSGIAWCVFFVVGVWMLAVMVRILRGATEWPTIASIMLALTIEILTLLATLAMYPVPATTPAAA